MLTSLPGEPAEQSVCTMLWSITSGLANHPSCQSYCSLSLSSPTLTSIRDRGATDINIGSGRPIIIICRQVGLECCFDFCFVVGCFLLTGWVPPTYFVMKLPFPWCGHTPPRLRNTDDEKIENVSKLLLEDKGFDVCIVFRAIGVCLWIHYECEWNMWYSVWTIEYNQRVNWQVLLHHHSIMGRQAVIWGN